MHLKDRIWAIRAAYSDATIVPALATADPGPDSGTGTKVLFQIMRLVGCGWDGRDLDAVVQKAIDAAEQDPANAPGRSLTGDERTAAARAAIDALCQVAHIPVADVQAYIAIWPGRFSLTAVADFAESMDLWRLLCGDGVGPAAVRAGMTIDEAADLAEQGGLTAEAVAVLAALNRR